MCCACCGGGGVGARRNRDASGAARSWGNATSAAGFLAIGPSGLLHGARRENVCAQSSWAAGDQNMAFRRVLCGVPQAPQRDTSVAVAHGGRSRAGRSRPNLCSAATFPCFLNSAPAGVPRRWGDLRATPRPRVSGKAAFRRVSCTIPRAPEVIPLVSRVLVGPLPGGAWRHEPCFQQVPAHFSGGGGVFSETALLLRVFA